MSEYVCVTCRKLGDVEQCLVLKHKVEVIYPVAKDVWTAEDRKAIAERKAAMDRRAAHNKKVSGK
jgi:hypothetical protein